MASRRRNIQRPKQLFNVRSYLLIHLHSFFASLGRFSKTPFNFMMTVGVIAITLSLPAGLLVSISNLTELSNQIDFNHNISLFLKQDITQKQAKALTASLAQHPHVEQATLIDKEAALLEFEEYSGFGLAIKALPDNPLPHVILLTPQTSNDQTTVITALIAELEKQPDIQLVQMDMDWLERLNGLLQIAQRAASLVTALLGLAVLLIISNTIRLELQNRKDEIDITRLVGATPAFITRPFLYSGFWYGFSGGVIACLIVNISIALLDGPSSSLANLYGSSFQLTFMPFSHAILWIIFSVSLGVSGAWVVVSRYLSELES